MVRIGIVGLGRAASALFPAMVARPEIEVVALAEPEGELRAAFCEDWKVRGFADAAELVGDPNVDVVDVATPHQFHCRDTVVAVVEGRTK